MQYQVREILLFGWTENFNTQAPEHCHIDFVKSVAGCTNNKDVFLTVLRYHVRDGMIQYLRTLNEDLLEVGEPEQRQEGKEARNKAYISDRNDSISCDLGIRYPTFQSIMSGKRNHLSLHVRYRMRYRML
jgi:hypothetical protein